MNQQTIVFPGAEVEPHWLETEFLELDASVDAQRQLNEMAVSP